MSKKESDDEKETTQAIASQPQEEFISPVNRPSKPESEAGEDAMPADDHEPPRH